jgi:hypothetical protein
MNNITKKSALGITIVAATTMIVAGFAAPAMASASHDSSLDGHAAHSVSSTKSDSTTNSQWTTTQSQLDALRTITTGIGTGTASNSSPVVVAPSLSAPVSTGDIGSGDAVASGNETPVLSGNTVSVPVLSGNETAAGNNDANGVGNGDLTGGINASVNNLVNSLTKDVGNSSSSTSSTGIVDSILGGR